MLPADYTLVERGLRAPGEAAANRLAAAFGYGLEALVADVSSLVDDALQQREALR
jgi:hypothetical protein